MESEAKQPSSFYDELREAWAGQITTLDKLEGVDITSETAKAVAAMKDGDVLKVENVDKACSSYDGPVSPKKPTQSQVMSEALDKVKGIVTGDRQGHYGTPSLNHSCTATMWSAWLTRRLGVAVRLTAADVTIINTIQKTARLANEYHEDGFIDMAGYSVNGIACMKAAEGACSG